MVVLVKRKVNQHITRILIQTSKANILSVIKTILLVEVFSLELSKPPNY